MSQTFTEIEEHGLFGTMKLPALLHLQSGLTEHQRIEEEERRELQTDGRTELRVSSAHTLYKLSPPLPETPGRVEAGWMLSAGSSRRGPPGRRQQRPASGRSPRRGSAKGPGMIKPD